MRILLSATLLVFVFAAPAAQPLPEPAGDLIMLDVIVRDGSGQPLSGLSAGEFEIAEDGRRMDVSTFTAMSASGSSRPGDGRTLVLLLDTAGVAPGGTLAIQTIARALLSRARAGDDVTVVRLGRRSDEPYGDLLVAADRIADYVAASSPFVIGETQETLLKTVASLSAQLEGGGERRKGIVCIGSMAVCNPIEPIRTARRSMLESWYAAVSGAARANAGVFAVIPATLTARSAGIVDFTGGEIFAGTNVVGASVDGVWRAVSEYYLLGYWARDVSVDLRSIKVTVARDGARVLVRRAR